MAYRLHTGESFIKGVRRVAGEQLDSAIDAIDSEKRSAAEKVHDARKRCKKLRGLVRLVRPALGKTYREENEWFRDTARPLSELRDAKTMQDAYDALVRHFAGQVGDEAVGWVRRLLTENRREVLTDREVQQRLQYARERFAEARLRVEDWSLKSDGFDTVGAGLAKTYGRARKALARAARRPSPESFHEARKRVKYHWHHCRLLEQAWPAEFKARQKDAKRVSDLLGDDHDLAVLAGRVSAAPEPVASGCNPQVLLDLVERRRAELECHSMRLGRRLFVEEEPVFRCRVQGYWKAAKTALLERAPLAPSGL